MCASEVRAGEGSGQGRIREVLPGEVPAGEITPVKVNSCEVVVLIAGRGVKLGGGEASDGVERRSPHFGAGDAQSFFDIFGFDFLTGEADHLIESRLRIAHRAVTGARDLADCFIGN